MPRTRTPLYLALRKRSEALASIQVHRRWIGKLEDRVRDLERAIEDLGGFPTPKEPRLKFNARGIIQKTMYALLRERGEVTTISLAAAVMEAHIPKPHHPKDMAAMVVRAGKCIKRNEARGIIRHVGGAGVNRQPKRYALALR